MSFSSRRILFISDSIGLGHRSRPTAPLRCRVPEHSRTQRKRAHGRGLRPPLRSHDDRCSARRGRTRLCAPPLGTLRRLRCRRRTRWRYEHNRADGAAPADRLFPPRGPRRADPRRRQAARAPGRRPRRGTYRPAASDQRSRQQPPGDHRPSLRHSRVNSEDASRTRNSPGRIPSSQRHGLRL